MQTLNQRQIRNLRIPTVSDAENRDIKETDIATIDETNSLYICKPSRTSSQDISLANGMYLLNISAVSNGDLSSSDPTDQPMLISPEELQSVLSSGGSSGLPTKSGQQIPITGSLESIGGFDNVDSSVDGSVMAIGIRGYEYSGVLKGTVMYFIKEGSSFTQKVLPGSEFLENESVGSAISLSGDGTTLAVTHSYFHSPSSNYIKMSVWKLNGSTFERYYTYTHDVLDEDCFRWIDVSDDGSRIVAGGSSSRVMIFNHENSAYTLSEFTLDSNNTIKMCIPSISGDGSTIVVGSPFYTENSVSSGRAFVYEGDTLSLSQTLQYVATDAYFARSVSLDYTGDTLVLGHYNTAKALQVYKRDLGNYSLFRSIQDDYPHRLSYIGLFCRVSSDGRYVYGGDPRYVNPDLSISGRIILHDLENNETTRLTLDNTTEDNLLGYKVAISNDMTKLITYADKGYDGYESTPCVYIYESPDFTSFKNILDDVDIAEKSPKYGFIPASSLPSSGGIDFSRTTALWSGDVSSVADIIDSSGWYVIEVFDPGAPYETLTTKCTLYYHGLDTKPSYYSMDSYADSATSLVVNSIYINTVGGVGSYRSYTESGDVYWSSSTLKIRSISKVNNT